jgi:mannose-6-phosphate isomerase-like protein (cupin superfamily)
MEPEVVKAAEVKEFATPERCAITELANRPEEQSSVALARVSPGVTTAWHKLRDISEMYLLVSGKGLMEMEGIVPTEVTAGDLVRIPPNTAQRISNVAESELLFYCVCTPGFRPDRYQTLE